MAKPWERDWTNQQAPAVKPWERNWGQPEAAPAQPVAGTRPLESNFFGDMMTSLGIGGANTSEMIGTMYGLAADDMDNALRSNSSEFREFLNEKKSPYLRSLEAAREAKAAEQDSEFMKGAVTFWETVKSPYLSAASVTEMLPDLAVGGVVGRVAMGGARRVLRDKLEDAATQKAAEQTVRQVGLTGAVTSETAMEGADPAGQTYDELMALPDELWLANPEFRASLNGNMDLLNERKSEYALDLARNNFALGGLLSLGTRVIPGSDTIEKALVGMPGPGGRISRGLTGFAAESAQEALQEGGGQTLTNVAVQTVDPERQTFEGVGVAAGMGAAPGGIIGGAMGLVTPSRPAETPGLTPEEKLAQAKNVDEMVAAAQEMAGTTADVNPEGGSAMAGPVTLSDYGDDGSVIGETLYSPNADGTVTVFERDAYGNTTDTNLVPKEQVPALIEELRIAAPDAVVTIDQVIQQATAGASAPIPAPGQALRQQSPLNLEALRGVDTRLLEAEDRMEFVASVNTARNPDVSEAVRESALRTAAEIVGRSAAGAAPLGQTPTLDSMLTEREQLETAAPTEMPPLGTVSQMNTRAGVEAPPVAGQTLTALDGQVAQGELDVTTDSRPAAPRPTRILGKATDQYSDEELGVIIADDRTPAISRRGAEIELNARAGVGVSAAPLTAAPIAQQAGAVAAPIANIRTADAPILDEGTPVIWNQDGVETSVDFMGIETDPDTNERLARVMIGRVESLVPASEITLPQGTTLRERQTPAATPAASVATTGDFLSIPAPVSDVAAQPVAGQSTDAAARATAQQALDAYGASRGEPSPIQFGEPPADVAAGFSELADSLKATFGGAVVPYYDTNPDAPNGVAVGGTAYVNLYNPDQGAPFTAAHETFHIFEAIANTERAQGLVDTPAQELVDQFYSIFDDMTDAGKRAYAEKFLYKDELDQLSGPARETRLQELLAGDELRSEMVADFMGKRLSDRKFLEDLAKADPSGFEQFVKRWLAAIDNLLNKLKAQRTGTQSDRIDEAVQDLTRAKMIAQSALINYRKSVRAVAQPSGTGVSFSARQETQRGQDTAQRAGGVQPDAESDRPSPGADRGYPQYGEPVEGAISVDAVHYSNQARDSLTGSRYGSGARGAESRRVANSGNPELRNRIYFYVDTGNGITPEVSVGTIPHRVQLNNIYDVTSGQIRESDANTFEEAVMAAGFDGYYVSEFGAGNQGAVVLLGSRHSAVPVAGPADIRFSKKQTVGGYKVSVEKDGSITVKGDAAEIRAKLPAGVTGRATKDGLSFPATMAPRVMAALGGESTAYSRAGAVATRKPVKDGKYIGAPEKYNSPGTITSLRRQLKRLTDEGARGRYWYENSSQEVLRMVGGNVTEARKFVALLSIYSPQAKVDTNGTFALRAWAQYKAGQPIDVKTAVQDRKAQEALDDVDAFWSGEKTANFYVNLLRMIDPTAENRQGATIDMWMMRAAEYDTDAPARTQYMFMEDEVNRIAAEKGWEPQQVQAAIWTAMKARMESKPVVDKTELTSERKGFIKFVANGKDVKRSTNVKGKKRVVIDKAAHRTNWIKQALAYEPTAADVTRAKFDFGDALMRHVGQVSVEARPSTSTPVLPGIHTAAYAQQVEFQQAILRTLYDETGADTLAQQLGLMVDSQDLMGPGVWDGVVSPSTQMQVAMAPAKGAVSKDAIEDAEREGAEKPKPVKNKVDPAQAQALNTYTAVLGLVLRQDGTGWHRPFYSATKQDANGVDVRVGRSLNPEETADLEKAVGQWMTDNGHLTYINDSGETKPWNDGFALVASPDGIRMLNFGVISNAVMQKQLLKAVAPVLPDHEFVMFASDGNMPTNNWKENPNGQNYINAVSKAGRSDILDWARSVLAPRVQSVYDEFSEKYNWGDPGQISFSRREGGRTGGRQVPDGEVQTPERTIRPLEGAPRVEGFTGPDPRLVTIAEKYAADNDIPYTRQSEYVEVDEARARRIADAYAQMRHAPQDPRVKAAYQDMIDQALAQYQALVDDGYQFWFIDTDIPSNAEYASSPWNAMRDIRANQTMGIFPTAAGFGSDATFDPKDNPLLADTGLTWPNGSLDGEPRPVYANDIFRAVHDAFGHGLEGAGFRARGEENAWQAHARLFTGPALGALTSETRGQNSWLNYGPNGETNRTAKVEDTVFADQKTGLMPEWTWTEGRAGDAGQRDIEPPRIETFNGLKLRRVSADIKVSAASAFADGPFTILPGVREVPLADVALQGGNLFDSEDERKRIAALAKAIESSGSIEPVFVAKRADGSMYVAEGQHRSRALISLGYDSLPARVMVEGRVPDIRFSRRQTDTPEFKRWFGDSKVVGADGQPMVVYHGSRTAEPFEVFETPSYFTDRPEFAGNFGIDNTYKVYLRIQNPYEIDGEEEGRHFEWDDDDVADMVADGYDGVIVKHPDGDVYTVFEPTQIKSATDNSGAFDPENASILFSRRQQPFYSDLKNAVAGMPERMRTQPAKQWIQWLTSPSNQSRFGFKKDEVTWSGVEDYLNLRGKDKVTADEIVQYLADNNVIVQDVVLKGDPLVEQGVYPDGTWMLPESGEINDLYSWRVEMRRIANAEELDIDDLLGELVDVSGQPMGVDDGFGGAPEYGQYVAGWGANYREVLLTLPIKEADAPLRFKMSADGGLSRVGEDYISSHWGTRNVLAHLRVDDRATPAGESVLFVNEVQSDWGQGARKKGIKNERDAEIAALRAEAEANASRLRQALRGVDYLGFDNVSNAVIAIREFPDFAKRWDVEGTEVETLGDNYRRLNTELREALPDEQTGAVPRAPFIADTESWVTLALKRAIGMAVDGGYDKLAFVNGEQAAEMFDLSKRVGEIWYNKQGGTWDVNIYAPNGDTVSRETRKSAEDLEGIIGKELAQKIVTGDGSPDGVSDWMILSGLDLKVGGEGMTAFYDGIVPNILRKLAKKFGGKVAVEPIPISPGQKAEEQLTLTITDDLRKQVEDVGMPMFSRRQNVAGQPAPLAQWSLPRESTFKDDFIRKFQNKYIDVKRVVDAISSSRGVLDDKFDPNLKEELFHKRAAIQTERFAKDEIRPLMKGLVDARMTIADLEEYLHNRHAEERNIQIAKVNPNMPDGGSGLKTADARAYLAALPAAKRRQLDALGRMVDGITANTRNLLITSGLETQSTIDNWTNAYGSYVPLFREDADFMGNAGMGTGAGFSVRGAASRRATGSERPVVDILANIMMQRERVIVRAEKNRVAQAVYGMTVQNPNSEYWLPVNPDAKPTAAGMQALINELVSMGLSPSDADNIMKEPKVDRIDPKTGLTQKVINPRLRDMDNVYHVRINGKDRFVFFNQNNERAEQMVRALKNIDADQLSYAVGQVAKVTRWFASVNTQYNPIFGIINMLRDTQGALIQLDGTAIADKKAKVLGGVFPAMAEVYKAVRMDRAGSRATGPWADLWYKFQEAGGQTGYRDQFQDSAARAKALNDEMERFTENKAKKGLRAAFDWLSDYNDAMENAVRLSAFKVALDNGQSEERAASIAKNLTVNFNRKGQVATEAGAWYAFFNAAVQGTTKMAQVLSGPTGKKVFAGGIMIGVAQALAMAAAGFDEEEPPLFVRERNLIIPFFDENGRYFTIPMPLGYNVIPNMGRIITEFALSGFKDPGKRAVDVFSSMLDMFNPIGNAGMSMQTLAPTIADIPVALFENQDWTGNPIAREDFSSLNPTPGYLRTRDSASVISKLLSEFFNYASFGGEFEKGFFSPTPDQLDYFIGQVTGGVGRESLKILQTGQSLITGEDLPLYKIPLGGRFVGKTTGKAAESNRFYASIERLNVHRATVEGFKESGRSPAQYLQENPEARLAQLAGREYRTIQNLNKRRREMIQRDASRESVRMIETQIETRMKRFNEKVAAIGAP